MRKHLSNILKIGITLLGLVIVLMRFDARAIGQVLQEASLGWLFVGLLLVIFSFVIRAYRWHLLIRGLHAKVTFNRLVELYFVGGFFNTFLPSGIGGDVVRILEVAQDIPSDIATGTVIIDRLTGLMMLFAIALLALPFRPADFPIPLLWTIVIISIAGLIAGFILLEGSALRRLIRLFPNNIASSSLGFLIKVAQTVEACGPRSIIGAFGVSVAFNLVQAAWWTTTGWALGLRIPFFYTLLVVPILSLAMLIPSIGGLGVREFLAPALFAGAGLTPEEAIALTLLVFAIERLTGLFGGPVYLYSIFRDRGKSSREIPKSHTN